MILKLFLGKHTENKINMSTTFLREKEVSSSLPDLDFDHYFNSSENIFGNTEPEQEIEKQSKYSHKNS